MKKYFDLVLDLLEIEEKADLGELADIIHTLYQEEKTIYFAHRYNYLLMAWYALLWWKMEIEEFIQIWDVDSAFPLYLPQQKTSKELIEELKNWIFPQEDILILDAIAWKVFLTPEEEKTLIAQLDAQKKKVILK